MLRNLLSLLMVSCLLGTAALFAQDTDADGILDASDNCPFDPNATIQPITIDGNIADFGTPIGTSGTFSYYFSADDTYFYIGVTGLDLNLDNLFIVFQNADGNTGVAQFGEDFSQNNWTYLIGFFGSNDICYYPFDNPFGCQQQGNNWFHYAGFNGNTTSEIRIPRAFLGSYNGGSGLVNLGIWANNANSSFVFSTHPSVNPTGPSNQLWLQYDSQPYPTFLPQDDADMDGAGDACDNCPTQANGDQNDLDDDGLGDACDNCPRRVNADQADGDGDNVGDLCDKCPTISFDSQNDPDKDGLGDECDNCPNHKNKNQADRDDDGVGNACDNCPEIPNADQTDSNNNGIGDACEEIGPGFQLPFSSPTPNKFSVYPNPSSQLVNIQLPTTDGQPIDLILYNTKGEIVWSQLQWMDAPGEIQLDLAKERLPNGSYFLIYRQGETQYQLPLLKMD